MNLLKKSSLVLGAMDDALQNESRRIFFITTIKSVQKATTQLAE